VKKPESSSNGQAEQCLSLGCDRKPYARGICRPCYSSAAWMVRHNQVSWDELETLGMARPSSGRGKRPTPFRAEFLRLKAESEAEKARKS